MLEDMIESHVGDKIDNLRTELLRRLDAIDRHIGLSRAKEFYTVAEVAELVHRTPYTVRQWCARGQIRANRIRYGRTGEWRIPHEELTRIEKDGPATEGSYNGT